MTPKKFSGRWWSVSLCPFLNFKTHRHKIDTKHGNKNFWTNFDHKKVRFVGWGLKKLIVGKPKFREIPFVMK